MAIKIRFTRIGRHNDPFYRIVVADERSARDGRYIEQIGYVDPKIGITSLHLDEEATMKWLHLGAIPSDSVRSLLSKKGIITKFAEEKKAKAATKPKKEKAPVKVKEEVKPETKKTATAKKAPATKKAPAAKKTATTKKTTTKKETK